MTRDERLAVKSACESIGILFDQETAVIEKARKDARATALARRDVYQLVLGRLRPLLDTPDTAITKE